MFFEKRRFSIEFNFQIKDFFLDEIPTNPCSSWGFVLPIIPYQVITGNYNFSHFLVEIYRYYTIPSDNRELQPSAATGTPAADYTIPSDNRELQHGPFS